MGETFNIQLPSSWQELSDEQLKTVYTWLDSDKTAAEIKTLCLMKWQRMEINNEFPIHIYLIKQGWLPS